MKWYKVFAHVSPLAFRVWQRNGDVFKTTILINFIPPLLEPVLYILAFGFGLGSLIKTVTYQGRQYPHLTFMAPGVISVAVMFWSYFETTYTCFVRMYYQRTFDAIVATPLLVEDVIVGEWIWGATKSLMACTIMLVGDFPLRPGPLAERLLRDPPGRTRRAVLLRPRPDNHLPGPTDGTVQSPHLYSHLSHVSFQRDLLSHRRAAAVGRRRGLGPSPDSCFFPCKRGVSG